MSTVRMPRCCRLLAVVAALASSQAHAQSAQPFGIQGAAFFTNLSVGGFNAPGYGIEPQFRLNRVLSGEKLGVVSVGIGGQFTTHAYGDGALRVLGGFVEPRWVPPLNLGRVVPYLSLRASFLRLSDDFQNSTPGRGLGAGAGVVVPLTRTINFDAGAQLVRQSFDALQGTGSTVAVGIPPITTYAAKVGLSLGFPSRRR